MARLARLTLPGHVHHVIQRGNNGQVVFVDAQDRILILSLIEQHAKEQGVAVHAYLLADKHFHLLLTPQTQQGVPRMMQAIGRAYVRHFNRRHARTGTLWEGRYRSTLIQAETQMVPCMVHMDRHPVQEGLVSEAAAYPWSSHAHYVGLRHDRLLTPHASYWALGNTPFAREAAYREQVETGLSRQAESALTQATLGGWALGDARFVGELEQLGGRRARPRTAGRPKGAGARLASANDMSPINSRAGSE